MSEGNFFCNWCGKMKPEGERVIEKDETGFPIWTGCLKCHKRRG